MENEVKERCGKIQKSEEVKKTVTKQGNVVGKGHSLSQRTSAADSETS